MALTDNLVSYWKLDESSGNAADSVGANTLTNTGTVTYQAGKINNGAGAFSATKYFDGGTGIFNFARADAFSVSYWLNRNGATFGYTVTRCTNAGGAAGWFIGTTATGGLRFAINGISALHNMQGDSAAGLIGTGAWHHIVVTKDTGFSAISSMTLYVDGSSVSVTDNSFQLPIDDSTTTANFDVGTLNNGTSSADAQIDEIGIWSRVLTSTEVTSLYNGGAGNQYPFGSAAAVNHWLLMGV